MQKVVNLWSVFLYKNCIDLPLRGKDIVPKNRKSGVTVDQTDFYAVGILLKVLV